LRKALDTTVKKSKRPPPPAPKASSSDVDTSKRKGEEAEDELFERVPKREYHTLIGRIGELKSDNSDLRVENADLFSSNSALQAEQREFSRLQKDGINKAVSYVFCTMLAVLGGIVISSDMEWAPFYIPHEYNRYIGVLIISVSIILGPVSSLVSGAVWHLRKLAKKHIPWLFP
jgi:hypothetical protein